MIGYQSMDGVPITANRWLLREVLKEEWGFAGTLVTDWDNVGSLVRTQKVCADAVEAAADGRARRQRPHHDDARLLRRSAGGSRPRHARARRRSTTPSDASCA